MNEFLLLIVIFLIADFALDTLVDLLNLRALSTELPAEFRGFYDEEKYRKSQEYLRANTRYHLVEGGAVLVATLAFIALEGFRAVDAWARGFGFGEIATGLVFIGALGLFSSALHLPFSIYHTFVIEERFGFNRTTARTFLGDLVKGLVLSVVIGGPILALVLWFFETTGERAWLYAWGGMLAVQLVLMFLAPAVLMPLFNKFEPLAEGELKREIEAFAKRLDFHVSGLYTMDGSKRSAKANAFFTGFGKFRRIVLFDTLIAKHSVPELVSVLAHEIGHFRLRHIHKMFAFSAFSTGLLFGFLSLLIENEELFAAFSMEETSVYASLVFAALLFSPAGKIIGVLGNILSRRHEYEADAFAARTYGEPETLVTALKRLSVENLANLNPHPWKVFLEYSHPPVQMRICALRNEAR